MNLKEKGELIFMSSVFELIKKRCSVRSYQKYSLSADEKKKIESFIAQLPSPRNCERLAWHLKTVSPVGSAKLYCVLPDFRPEILVCYGFQGEILVLKLVELGLGTCWLGVGRALEKNTPAVIVLGQESRPNLIETVMRFVLRSHKRKILSDLISAESRKPSPELLKVLEAMRLAPSAVNRQPWRFSVKSEHCLEVKRTGGHKVWSHIDLGIVLAHGYLAGKELFGRATVSKEAEGKYELCF